MTEQLKNTLKGIFGVLLIVLGVAGMILPVLPGVWFIPLGLQLLGLKLVINRKKSWAEMIRIKRWPRPRKIKKIRNEHETTNR